MIVCGHKALQTRMMRRLFWYTQWPHRKSSLMCSLISPLVSLALRLFHPGIAIDLLRSLQPLPPTFLSDLILVTLCAFATAQSHSECPFRRSYHKLAMSQLTGGTLLRTDVNPICHLVRGEPDFVDCQP